MLKRSQEQEQEFIIRKKRRVEDNIKYIYPDQNDSWSAKSFRAFSYDNYIVG